jgi:hypothetical protein
MECIIDIMSIIFNITNLSRGIFLEKGERDVEEERSQLPPFASSREPLLPVKSSDHADQRSAQD